MIERIHKVGLELEGGWTEAFPEEDPTEIIADHSVHLEGYTHTGEVASPPLSLEEALKWCEEHYPVGMDATCGIHIHLSTKSDEDYAKVASSPHFYMRFLQWGKTFIEGMEDTDGDRNLFYSRLSGKNRFCALKFIPEKQLRLIRKGTGNTIENNPRYAMLNFCKSIHGTFENRTFPTFYKKENALKAIEGYVKMVDDFLIGREFQEEVVRVVV